VRVRNITGYFIHCYVWLQLCVNFAGGICCTKRKTSGDEGKDGHAVKETRVFGRIFVFPPTVEGSVKGPIHSMLKCAV